ncbi:hypothetical protein GOODEAATRI_026499, partial [Goodea atripinnis]
MVCLCSLVQFHPDISRLQLFSSSLDCGIRLWDLRSSQCVCILQSHYSAVTSLSFSGDGGTMIRYREIGHPCRFIKNLTGVLRVWEASTARCVYTQTLPSTLTLSSEEDKEEDNPRSVTYLFHLPASSRLATVTAEHNILFYQLPSLTTHQQDRSVCVWQMDSDSGEVRCVAQGSSHTNAVGSISCSRMKASFVVTGSQDCTVKVWDLPAEFPGAEIHQLSPRTTEKAHDKDVNSVAVSPNDKLLASGSQDRTAKLWSLTGDGNLGLLGVFRGHRRGIWSVCFSPVDQVLASSSADGTTKLWSLQDFSCLKTFEGHDASVLKVIFVSRGTQLLTSGSDGLVKLWTIKTNECVKTLDAHQDKVWGLHASRKDDKMVTGSADSNISVWVDVTEVELAEEQAKQEDQIL